MLQRLLIQNLVTIDQEVIEFQSGLSVITGETGAGKSVILKAVALILGEKASKKMIRTGEKFLLVEAVFDLSQNLPLQELLRTYEIDFGEELVIRRKVQSSGKNSIYLNELSSSLSLLAQVGGLLVDMHGQHAQQSLLNASNHLLYLDKFAKLDQERKNFEASYHSYKEKLNHKKELESSLRERTQRLEFVRFQWEEIEKAQLSVEEEESLHEEFNQLSHADQLRGLVGEIAAWEEMEGSPVAVVSSILPQVGKAVEFDKRLDPILENLNSALISLEESVKDVSSYLHTLEVDPTRLEFVNVRLSEVEKLKRKYGDCVEDVLLFQEKLQQEMSTLENLEESHEELDTELAKLLQELEEKAQKLSEKRRAKAPALEKLILKELKDLDLVNCRFQTDIQFLEEGKFFTHGKDRISFLVATNPGSLLGPLTKSVSGGELSRIMLGIKTTLQESHSLPTMIFDEIDTGISGRTAERVGKKLRDLGEIKQIICITHLPQIAALANFHLRVEKNVVAEYTRTLISEISQEERIKEIARFIGGAELTEKTLSAAQEMLKL